MYGVVPYFLSKLMVEAPKALLSSGMTWLTTYWLVEFNGNFAWLVLVTALFGLVASSTALVIGSISPNVETAIQLTPLLFVPQLFFSGFYVPITAIPIYLRKPIDLKTNGRTLISCVHSSLKDYRLPVYVNGRTHHAFSSTAFLLTHLRRGDSFRLLFTRALSCRVQDNNATIECAAFRRRVCNPQPATRNLTMLTPRPTIRSTQRSPVHTLFQSSHVLTREGGLFATTTTTPTTATNTKQGGPSICAA